MNWIGDPVVAAGVVERGFEVAGGAGLVPGVLWTPSEVSGPVPLVLMGHGGGGHKRDEHRTDLAYTYVLDHGIAAAAIDGPAHGDRALPDGTRPDYGPALVDQMVVDWRATLDALAALEEIDETRVAYGGVSMGTIFGLPFIASEPRIRAAVLGLAGLHDEFGRTTGINERLAHDAPSVRCPVLFIVQWDDELVARDGAFELFGLLGSPDKRMHVHPGSHHEVPLHSGETTTRFLAEQLTGL
jgi:cephalosporin-C deacetylase-like acetyl esterase